MLEVKRVALEEAVERAVCEKIYEKLWKHRTTDDDARDEKLRSRTAALSLVGIGLKELHVDIDPTKGAVNMTDVQNWHGTKELSENQARLMSPRIAVTRLPIPTTATAE